MQDEVRDKSVALAIKVGKTGGRLTADLLKWAGSIWRSPKTRKSTMANRA